MSDDERIELVRSYCQFAHYPPELTETICTYLAGQGTLDALRQHEQPGLANIFTLRPALLDAWQFGWHGIVSKWQLLDALDGRLLDVCYATAQVRLCLQELGDSTICRQVLSHLLAQGMTPQALLHALSGLPYRVFGQSRQLQMVELLLDAEPPALEAAWGIIGEIESAEEPHYMSVLGHCAALLLKADPARFTTWARKIAAPSSPASQESRLVALRALLELDATQHLDLAEQVMDAPMARYGWTASQLQRDMLESAYQHDPLKLLPLVGRVALSENWWLADHAMRLLTQAPAEQARPLLQQCVSAGGISIASRALQVLLGQQWAGCLDYATSLLAHRYKRIRKEATDWLALQGDAALEGTAPFLAHADPAIRLSAIDAQRAIGSQGALALLAARLGQEKTPKVRQAIFGVVGLPAEQQQPGPLTKETLQARANAALRYVSKPAPRWFVPAEVAAPLWTNNEPVPPAVLLYLLYRQSFATAPGQVDGEVALALALLNRSTTGSLAHYLFSGWVAHGPQAKDAWCLPLICTLADDALLPALSLRVEDWSRDNRRKLAIRIIRALPLCESQAAIAELRSLAELLRRGVVKTAAKATLAAAGG